MITLWGYDISWLIWFCASGKSFFVGTALLIFSVLLPIFRKSVWSRIVKYSIAVIAIFLIILSATPFAWLFYAAWITSILIFFLLISVRTSWTSRLLRVFQIIAVGMCVIAILLELPFHLKPTMPEGKFEKLYIIGDSISAGIGNRDEQTWPKILHEKYAIDVIDLSLPGATVTSAVEQANKVSLQDAVVLLEIGGNDFFASTPYTLFEQDLKRILKRVRNAKRAVIMLELPLQPQYLVYGTIQRKTAKEFDATLVPKKFIVSILGSKGATVDLAHLSPYGHELMAERIWSLLKPCFHTKDTGVKN
jgi:acyl-CoA thioesterase-1